MYQGILGPILRDVNAALAKPAGYYVKDTGELIKVAKFYQPHGIPYAVTADGREFHESQIEWRGARK